MKLKLKMFLNILARIKKYLILVIIRLRRNCLMIQNKLVTDKMKDKTGGVATEEFFWIEAKEVFVFRRQQ